MLEEKFYPTLADLVNFDSLPDNLDFLQQPLTNILDKIFYKDLQSYISPSGHNGSFNLDIILCREIVLFKVPGTDIKLLLNPIDPVLGSDETIFNFSLEYQWEILKFFYGGFKLNNFDFSIPAFLGKLTEAFGITDKELLRESINAFVGETWYLPENSPLPLDTFVLTYNNSYSPITSYTDFDDVYTQITTTENAREVIIQLYVNSFDDLKTLLSKWLGLLNEDDFKKIILPSFSISINEIYLGLEFPESIFQPVNPAIEKALLTFTVGSLTYSTENGLEFNNESSFSFTESYILNSGFSLSFDGAKLDLSRKKNIPEAIADGRPNDFVGVYVQEATIGLPPFFNDDTGNSDTAAIKGRNLLIGTGGISGTIGLEALIPEEANPILYKEFSSGFGVGLNHFRLTFHQNSITECDISGLLKLRNLKNSLGNAVEISIRVLINDDGFAVTATEAVGFDIEFKNILNFHVKSLTVGQLNDRWFLKTVSKLSFNNDPNGPLGPLAGVLPEIDLSKLTIWENGRFEIGGGGISLPVAINIKLGNVKIAITAIHTGTDEIDRREYMYFGFDGGIDINPGGVDARGDGIKFYFTIDEGDFKCFLRIESISINIVIPGTASKETAQAIISGYLSMKQAENGSGTEYTGGVDISLPKMGLSASANYNLEEYRHAA